MAEQNDFIALSFTLPASDKDRIKPVYKHLEEREAELKRILLLRALVVNIEVFMLDAPKSIFKVLS